MYATGAERLSVAGRTGSRRRCDLDTLATFDHPDVTIYEGDGINNGWIDYRDRHLGPELKSFENLLFGHSNTEVTVLPGGLGRAAYEDDARCVCEPGGLVPCGATPSG